MIIISYIQCFFALAMRVSRRHPARVHGGFCEVAFARSCSLTVYPFALCALCKRLFTLHITTVSTKKKLWFGFSWSRRRAVLWDIERASEWASLSAFMVWTMLIYYVNSICCCCLQCIRIIWIFSMNELHRKKEWERDRRELARRSINFRHSILIISKYSIENHSICGFFDFCTTICLRLPISFRLKLDNYSNYYTNHKTNRKKK